MSYVFQLWKVTFYSATLVTVILAVFSIILSYYYISLFLHLRDRTHYISILSKVVQGGLLRKEYKKNLFMIEKKEDEKTFLLLSNIISLTRLGTKIIVIDIALIFLMFLLHN